MEVTLTINGDHYQFAASPDEVLLDTLRKLGYKSVKRGCETASCGVCNILLDGKLIPACSYLTVRADHREITTLEGLEHRAREIGQYIVAQGAEQCGYCSPGHMMAFIALLNENPNPNLAEIRHALAGNLCRCSGYEGQHRGFLNYLSTLSGGERP